MAQVNGIGGFFFRARDPETLSAWYKDHLGVDLTAGVWMQQAGPTVFVPFDEDSDYFPADRRWMMNFRTDDLGGLIRDLQQAGIAVETRDEWDSEIGRFARIHDPEGNPIELWQPTGGN